MFVVVEEELSTQDFSEIKGKKTKGVGFGNIFGDGPIKLRKTQDEPQANNKVDPPMMKVSYFFKLFISLLTGHNCMCACSFKLTDLRNFNMIHYLRMFLHLCVLRLVVVRN